MKIRPIKKIIVNNIEITDNINLDELYINDEAAWYACVLFKHSAYPNYLKTQVESRYGNQSFLIEPSNHIKYKKQRIDNPEWF